MDEANGTAERPSEAETPAAAGEPTLPEGAVASVRMPIETVIPAVAGPTPPPAATARTSTTPVAAAAEATMRFLRSLAHQPRPASQHKD
jgi:hypothetical protein